jgi:Fe-S-cluster containining protein
MSIKKETPKETVLKIAKECCKCGHCCRHTSGFILKNELKRIAEKLGTNEENLKKQFLEQTQLYNKNVYRPKRKNVSKGYGECVFHEDICKIHEAKPLFCAISNCSGHRYWLQVIRLKEGT